MNPVDSNGFTELEREHQSNHQRFEKYSEDQLNKAMLEVFDEIDRDIMYIKKAAAPAKRPPPTIASRGAASALSRPTKPVARLTKAPAPAAARPRAHPVLNIRKARTPVPVTDDPAAQRSATAASRNTLGYAQGRAVSQRVRKPATGVFRDDSISANATIPRDIEDEEALSQAKDIVDQLRVQDVKLDEEEEEEELFGHKDFLDDELDDFQLAMPEDGS